MKGVQLTKLAQELNLTNLTPDIDLTEIYVKTADWNNWRYARKEWQSLNP